METEYSIALEQIINEFQLEVIYLPTDAKNILLSNAEVNRPGLALAGFFGNFDPSRVEIIGKAEYGFLSGRNDEERDFKMREFIRHKPTCVIFSTGLEIFPAMLEEAKAVGVPILLSRERTSSLMASLIASLNMHLAPRLTRHGVLVNVYGEGILILGDSGVGKSETAIELVKRGHRLIADDAVEIKRASAKTLVGSAPEIIRHYVELRGIGIVDVKRLFGMGSVMDSDKINLIINLEQWVPGKMYDRLGLDDETMDILGVEIPTITIPVRPGRNLAIILEIAAMNNRQKRMGYNTAEEFNKKLLAQMEGKL